MSSFYEVNILVYLFILLNHKFIGNRYLTLKMRIKIDIFIHYNSI